MLNELYGAAVSMDESGINPKRWHKEYRPVRKASLAFWIFLDEFGDIAEVERVGYPTSVTDLHTWESKGDLRQSFPYFNIPPLLHIEVSPNESDANKAFDKELSENKLTTEKILKFLERTEQSMSTRRWGIKAHNKLKSCLEKGKSLIPMVENGPKSMQSLSALIQRLAQVPDDEFYNRLYNAFRNKLLTSPSEAKRYFEAAFYTGEKEPGNTVTLLLELIDGTSHFEYPVRHNHIRDCINTMLLSRDAVQGSSAPAQDIFGNDDTGWEQSFDEVLMRNALGNVKLRAMARAAICQRRYGKAESNSCRVGQISRTRMKGALEWLTSPERENKTWGTVSRASDNREVLLAYPSQLPPEPPQAAMLFGGSGDRDSDNTGRFENCARNVTGALRGLISMNPDLDIRVFLLRKMDAARTRVSSHKRCSAQHFLKAAGRWHAGSRNVPRILMIKKFTGERESTWCRPETPFPMEMVWALNTLWSHDGTSVNRVKGITADDAIDLLIEDEGFLGPILDRMLYAARRNLMGLALALGQAHAQGQVLETKRNYARQTLILPSVLGLLLYKLNIRKERYMRSPPYLVGRLLSLADQLHYHYCQHVRNGSVPPQLMGNALMATALEEPVKALALYCNRILPYQAWARTVSGEAAGRARYLLSELGKISSALGDVCAVSPSISIPERCTAAEKAQMLIGYLARPEALDSERVHQGDKA